MVYLIGKSSQYEARRREGTLPEGLTNLLYSVPWPITPETPNLHLSCFYGEVNYSDPEGSLIHTAVDIQVPPGTPVFVPEKARVIYYSPDPCRKLADIYLWGEDSKILYVLLHLDKKSFSPSIRKRIYLDTDTKTTVNKGECIGKVGEWPYQLSNEVSIPKDIEKVYGRGYHHLHFGTAYYPNKRELWDLARLKNQFNPLLILKNLSESET